jgi:hypothetical protein
MAAVIVGIGAFAASSATTDSGWALEGNWSDTCSCKVTCPCLVGSGPTEKFCEGSSLLEVTEGHYGGVELDGVVAVVAYRVGKWARIYVSDEASDEQKDAVAAVIPQAVPFLGLGPVETVETVSIAVDRSDTMLEWAVPETKAQIEMVVGSNGEPVKIENLPVKGLPFPEFHDHTQYKSVLSKHESDGHSFEWSDRNGFTSKVDQSGEIPSGDA